MSKRVLIIGSSAALPRPGSPYEETWPCLLQDARPDLRFIALSKRRNNSRSLTSNPEPKEWSYGDNLRFYSPDYVIIQMGISDCLPRYMRHNLLNRALDRMPQIMQAAFWKPYKLFFKRSLKRTDVPLDEFKRNVAGYLDQCMMAGVSRVVIVSIYTPPKWLTDRINLLLEGVRLYNDAFQEAASNCPIAVYITPLIEGLNQWFLQDGLHCTAEGHQKIANAVLEHLPK